MLAFLSYQTEDRVVAASVAKILESIGVQSFMAHEHLEVSVQWREEILRQLGQADLFIPILSQRYYASIWCKQESGIAAFRGITMIPLSIDGSIPQGFIGHIQSTLIENMSPTYQKIFPGLAAHDVHFTISAITRIIARSGNFRGAEANFALVLPYLNRATDQQIVDLLNASYENKQICHAGLCARDYLPPIFNSHGKYLQPEVRADLSKIFAQYAVPPPVAR
jgi:TIR domain-containing protein